LNYRYLRRPMIALLSTPADNREHLGWITLFATYSEPESARGKPCLLTPKP